MVICQVIDIGSAIFYETMMVIFVSYGSLVLALRTEIKQNDRTAFIWEIHESPVLCQGSKTVTYRLVAEEYGGSGFNMKEFIYEGMLWAGRPFHLAYENFFRWAAFKCGPVREWTVGNPSGTKLPTIETNKRSSWQRCPGLFFSPWATLTTFLVLIQWALAVQCLICCMYMCVVWLHYR